MKLCHPCPSLKIITHPLYVESKKKMIQMNLQNKKRLTDLENELKLAEGGEGAVRDFGKVMYTLLYFEWITNKNLLYSEGTLLRVMCQRGWERGLRESGYMQA